MGASMSNNAAPVGRPRIVTDKLEALVIAFLFKVTLETGNMPSDSTAAEQVEISERSFRSIRLKHGLDRWTIRRLLAESKKTEVQPDNSFPLGYTPFGGAWLLIPLLLSSAIMKATSLLRMPRGVQVTAWQFVLTILWWSILGFSRFFHLDDFRSKSDLGLALLTGRIKLLADSTLWRVLHSLPKESIEAFYEVTAVATIDANDPVESHGEAEASPVCSIGDESQSGRPRGAVVYRIGPKAAG